MRQQNHISRLILVALCFLSSIFASAQNYWFKNIGLTEGLASSQINSICKDSYGYLWLGTSAGLDRYDGSSIRHFRSDNSSNSLPDSYIVSIQVASDGMLWIKTLSGYVVMDPVTQIFDQSISQHLAMIDSNLDPQLIFFDKRKNMWVYDSNNTVYYYKHKQQLVFSKKLGDENGGLKAGEISGFCDCKDGVLAVYTNGNVVCMGTEQQKVLWYNEVIAHNTSLADNYNIFCDNDGNITVYGDAHCYFYNKAQAKWYTSFAQLASEYGGSSELGNELITGVSQDSKGNLWISTDRNGLICFNHTDHRLTAHITSGTERGLLTNNLETVYVDDTDLVWVGTSKYGLSYYAPNIYMFDVAHLGDVYGMSSDGKSGIWFATHGNGLVYRNATDGSTLSYTTSNGLNDNMLSCVLSASDGTVWAGSNRFGLNRLKGGVITVLQSQQGNNGKGLLDNNVQALAEDKFGNVWIGTRKGGLQCYNVKTGTFSNFNVQNNKILNNNVTSLCCKGSQLVAGTMNGIMLLNLSSNKSENYNGTKSGDKHFCSNVITQVYIDSRGLIWIGTRDGLNVLDNSVDQLYNFFENDGLPSNVICGIAEDKNHEIWVTTTKGVCKIAIQNGSNDGSRFSFNLFRYDVSDGLQGIEFNMGAIVSTNHGHIFMGGQNGINWIHNQEYKARKRPLKVILSRLAIDGQPIGVGVNYNGNVILPKMLNCMEEVRLRSSDKNISITLGVDDYNHAEHPRYIYQLEGIKDTWLPVTGDGHTLNLAYLSSGKYILRVKAMLDDGKTVSEEHTLVLIVEGPWYTRWWSILGLLIILALVGFGIYKAWPHVVGYHKKRKEELKKLQKRQDEFDTVAQELRGHVVGMIPQLGLLMMDADDAEEKEKLNGLQHSARQMLGSLNQLRDSQFVMVNDDGYDMGIVKNDGEEVLIGDDGPVGSDETSAEDFLVSDEGIISASGKFDTKAPTMRHHVFIVESDAELLEFVCDCLKSTYTIHTFTSAEDCLTAMSETRPSLIMSAELLSDMSGSQLCERIKNERSYERIPFILTTEGVLTQSDIMLKHITLMADDYIPSPYNLQSVIVRMNILLNEPNAEESIFDDTLRGAMAMQSSVQAQLKYTFDEYIRQNISRKDLSIEELCQAMNISRTQLFRKVEKVTGLTPTDYIRKVRLTEAAKLLESGFVSPAEAAEELGFGNLASFSKFFQNEFGMLPSQYAEGKRNSNTR